MCNDPRVNIEAESGIEFIVTIEQPSFNRSEFSFPVGDWALEFMGTAIRHGIPGTSCSLKMIIRGEEDANDQ